MTDANTSLLKDCLIQIPSHDHLQQMRGMVAGLMEDQRDRLSNMVRTIDGFHQHLKIIDSEDVRLPNHWDLLFRAIEEGNKTNSHLYLNEIPDTDPLLKSLLEVHSYQYIISIIDSCIAANGIGAHMLNSDVRITPSTFAILIKDIAVTLIHPTKLYFSFGLPTHHSYSSAARGFCIFNKSALIIRNKADTSLKPMRYVIIGTDVNRDDGLCNILRESASQLKICHVDTFDSRVYPGMDEQYIEYEFKHNPEILSPGVRHWQINDYQYIAIDLSEAKRVHHERHPALAFALNQLVQEIKLAKDNNEKVFILLPTGWDSHVDEMAFCGKFVGHFLTPEESFHCRYTNEDMLYFYEELFKIVRDNKEVIDGFYWGLEGGYEQAMYEGQIELMLSVLLNR